MPHANIWIRKANEARWAEIKDKSEWVNKMLQEGYIMVPGNAKKVTREMYARRDSKPLFRDPKKGKL